MQNRYPLKSELTAIINRWKESNNPETALRSLEQKREQRWQNPGLALASLQDEYDSQLMQQYISLLTELSRDPKVSAQRIVQLLGASSTSNHANLAVILTTQHKDSSAMQQYIQLLNMLANRIDIRACDMEKLACHQYSYEIDTQEKKLLDISNLLTEITCQLDGKTLCEFLQLLITLLSDHKLESHHLARLLTTPNSYQENIGELIVTRHPESNALYLLTELLNKCKRTDFKKYLPNTIHSNILLATIQHQPTNERMNSCRNAMQTEHPLGYMLQDQVETVKLLFAKSRQEKLLETIEQMPPHDQLRACEDALNRTTELGAITFSADSPDILARLDAIKSRASQLDTNGSELLADVFACNGPDTKVLSFTTSNTGLFKPEQLKPYDDEELGNVIQQGLLSNN